MGTMLQLILSTTVHEESVMEQVHSPLALRSWWTQHGGSIVFIFIESFFARADLEEKECPSYLHADYFFMSFPAWA